MSKTERDKYVPKVTPFIIRRDQLKATVGISPSSVDRLEASGQFPKRRKWSAGIVGWLASDVQEWAEQKGRE